MEMRESGWMNMERIINDDHKNITANGNTYKCLKRSREYTEVFLQIAFNHNFGLVLSHPSLNSIDQCLANITVISLGRFGFELWDNLRARTQSQLTTYDSSILIRLDPVHLIIELIIERG